MKNELALKQYKMLVNFLEKHDIFKIFYNKKLKEVKMVITANGDESNKNIRNSFNNLYSKIGRCIITY